MKHQSKVLIIWLLSLVLGLFICLYIGNIITKKASTDLAKDLVQTNNPPDYSGSDIRVVSSSTVRISSEGYYVSKPDNIEVIRLKGWDVVDPATANFSSTLGDLSFAFNKKGTKCIFGIANIFQGNTYVQTSFFARIMNDFQGQVGGSWYIERYKTPEGFKFNWHDRQPFPGEVAIMNYYPSIRPQGSNKYKAFVLFDSSGDVVDDTCIADAEAMLTTLREYLEDASVNANTKGVMYFNSGRNSRHRILMTNADREEGIIKKVTDFDIEVFNPAVYKNLIYISRNGKLSTFDIFTNKYEVVSGLATGTVVNMYIRNDQLFYLIGSPNCVTYLARCKLDLYRYDLKTKTNFFLQKGVSSRSISGYDPVENKVYMYWADGDAGCYWMRSEIFDMNLATTTSVRDLSGCDGDPNMREISRGQTEFLSKFSENATSSDALYIDSGNILDPKKQNSMWAQISGSNYTYFYW